MAEPVENHHSDDQAQGQNPNLKEAGSKCSAENEIKRLKDRNSSLKSDVQRLKGIILENNNKIDALTYKVSEQVDEIKQMKDIIAEKEKEIKMLKGKISTHSEELYPLQVKNDLGKADKEIELLACKFSTQDEEIKQLKDTISQRDEKVKVLTEVHQQQIGIIENLSAEKSVAQKEKISLQKLQQNLERAEQNILQCTLQLSEREEQIKRQKERHAREISILKRLKVNLEEETADLRKRLSEFASMKLHEDNPCVEDLSDPLRHTALKDKWDQIINNGEYWVAYGAIEAAVKDGCKTANILYLVLQVAYKVACDTVGEFRRTFSKTLVSTWSSSSAEQIRNCEEILTSSTWKNMISELLVSNGEWNLAEKDLLELALSCSEHCILNKEKPSQIPGAVDKLAVAFLKAKGPFPNSEKKLIKEIEEDSKVSKYKEEFWMLAAKVLDLFYFMRAQNIPLVVDFSYHEGSSFDPCLFQVEDKTVKADVGSVIDYVLFPPLLRCLKGGVLLKGEAVLKDCSKIAVPENNANGEENARDQAIETDGDGRMTEAGLSGSSSSQQNDDGKFLESPNTAVAPENNTETARYPPSNKVCNACLDDGKKSGSPEKHASAENDIDIFEATANMKDVAGISCTIGSSGNESGNTGHSKENLSVKERDRRDSVDTLTSSSSGSDIHEPTTSNQKIVDDISRVHKQIYDQGELPTTNTVLGRGDSDQENGRFPASNLPGVEVITARNAINGAPNLKIDHIDKHSSDNGVTDPDHSVNNKPTHHMDDGYVLVNHDMVNEGTSTQNDATQ